MMIEYALGPCLGPTQPADHNLRWDPDTALTFPDTV